MLFAPCSFSRLLLITSSYSNLKKGELEAVLDGFMQKHSTTLARDPSLSSYYKRMASSPVKRESEPMLADAKALVEKAPKVIRKVVKSARYVRPVKNRQLQIKLSTPR